MTRGRTTRWLGVPVAVGLAALLWVFLTDEPVASIGGAGSDREGAADAEAPDELAGEPGARLAGQPGDPRPLVAPDPDAAAVPTFPKSDGVFGRVLDMRDRPIPGARVSLFAASATPGYGVPDGPPAAVATSGADGAFLVGPAPAGRLRVRADAPGYASGVANAPSRGCCVDVSLDRGGALRLRVRDGAGAAVKGADARYVGASGAVTAAPTNETGEALLEALSPGPGHLRVLATGFAPLSVSDVVVAADRVVERSVVVGEGTAFRGRVLDEAGAPVEGAEVSVRPQWDPSAQGPAPVKTAADGTFSIAAAGNAGDWVQATASKEGYSPAAQAFLLQAMAQGGGQEVDLRLTKGGTLSGTVVDGSGHGVSGATVVYANQMGAWGGGAGAPATPTTASDSDGRFTMPLPPGTAKEWSYLVGASAPGAGVGAVHVSSAKPDGAQIRLSGTGTVSGKVAGSDGAPLEGASVALQVDFSARTSRVPRVDPVTGMNPWMLRQALMDPRLATLTAVTDATGAWRLDPVPAGSWRATASWGLERSGVSDAVSLLPGGSETLDLVVGGGITLVGSVVDPAGAGVAGAYVNAWDPTPRPRGNRGGQARSDAEGRFTLRGLGGDQWQVNVSAQGYASQSLPGVRAGGRPLEVRLLSLGWVEGIVLADGRPYAGAFTVSAQSLAQGGDARSREGVVNFVAGPGGRFSEVSAEASEQSFTSEDGRFTYRGVPAGPWRIQVTTREGLVPDAAPEVTVADGQGVGPVEVRLRRGASLTGRLLDEATRMPIEGGNVSLRLRKPASAGSPGSSNGWATTDAKGRYSLQGLAAGTYVVNIHTPSGFAWDEEVRLESGQGATKDLLAQRWGGVRAVVKDEAGAGIAGATVALQTERGTWVQVNWDAARKEGRVDFTKPGAWESLQQTDAAGVHQRSHVPPGRIKVVVTHRDFVSTGDVWIDVGSDRDTSVEIVLVKPGGADEGDDG